MVFVFPSAAAVKAALPLAIATKRNRRDWCAAYGIAWGPVESWMLGRRGQLKYDSMVKLIKAVEASGGTYCENDRFSFVGEALGD